MSGRFFFFFFFPLNKKVDSPSILHFLGGFRRLERFRHMIWSISRIELISAQLHHAFLVWQSIIWFLLKRQVGVRNIIFLLVLHLRIHYFSYFSATWLPSRVAKMSGTFCDKGEKCENNPNLPLGSFEVFICGESSPKFTMYRKKKG